MKRIVAVFGVMLLSLPSVLYAQMPRKLRAKETYVHPATQMTFPRVLLDEYQRNGIHAFDKPATNVGVSYEKITPFEKTGVTLYVYPAENGTEDRLRSGYRESLQMVANAMRKGLHATQFPARYVGADYICNGYKAVFKTEAGHLSQMTLFECGTWFFKIRITSTALDTVGMQALEDNILAQFPPSSLTARGPLTESSIYFASAGFRDTLMLGSVIKAATGKLRWAKDHVDAKERASGFPGLYLELHEQGLRECVDFEKTHKPTAPVTPKTRQYLDELNAIIDAGFLGEFIMEQYGMIMIVTPEGRTLDFEGFRKWKEENPVSIDLHAMYYVVSFDRKK